MRHYLTFIPLVSLLLSACSSNPAKVDNTHTAETEVAVTTPASDWVDADLSTTEKKLPIVIKAPKGYTIAKSPLGDVEIVTDALTFDVDDVTDLGADVLKDKKEDTQKNSGMEFEKFILEQPEGFIAQMGGSNYLPVRLVKVGGRTYQFSTIPLNAMQSESAAKHVYDMAALAKAK